MVNTFIKDLSKVVYGKSSQEEYGIGKPTKLSQEDLIKLWARFKIDQNQLYKINIENK